jgi:hypothetical protein
MDDQCLEIRLYLERVVNARSLESGARSTQEPLDSWVLRVHANALVKELRGKIGSIGPGDGVKLRMELKRAEVGRIAQWIADRPLELA